MEPGTGSLCSDGASPAVSSAVAPTVELSEAPLEQAADLCEYGRSLGVDVDCDEDLAAVVQEAFHAPLPKSWTEYTDDTGRVYYYNEASNQSAWEHPMDAVYRELLSLINKIRAEQPPISEASRISLIHEHLQEVHQRALGALSWWSGPYSSEQGDYYYNETLKASTWECPVTEWENEISIRHAVLSRCLVPGRRGGAFGSALGNINEGSTGHGGAPRDILSILKLPLNLVRREHPGDTPETPSTTRSFHTARSACSTTRSKRSGRSGDGRGVVSSDKTVRYKERRHQTKKVAHGPPETSPKEFTSVD